MYPLIKDGNVVMLEPVMGEDSLLAVDIVFG